MQAPAAPASGAESLPCAEAQRALSAAMPAQTASSEQERVARMAQERRADNERMQIIMALRRSAVRGTTYT